MLCGDELETERSGFGAEFGFLPPFVSEFIGGETGVIELLPGSDQVKDDARQFVCGCGDWIVYRKFSKNRFGS